MKKILGLDLGTNSIGWAVVNAEEVTREDETSYLKPTSISAAGSRIIPMDEGVLGDFDKGNIIQSLKLRTEPTNVAHVVCWSVIFCAVNDFCVC